MEVIQWRIVIEATLRAINEMLGVGWLPHQLSCGFDDESTSVFDMVLGIVIPSDILESV
jgi:hypothetical protein